MNANLKAILLLMILIFPLDAIAGIAGSFSVGYQSARKISLAGWVSEGHSEIPFYKKENSWGTLDADIGYNFGNKRWGVFLAVNQFRVEVKQFGMEPNIITGIDRTTLTFFCRAVVIGSPQTAQIRMEGGPSLHLQYAETRANYEMEQSAGGIAGISVVVPNRFSALLLRMRYIWCHDYLGFNTSGIGVSLGLEFD